MKSENQNKEETDDKDTDFSELMTKLKIDNKGFETLKKYGFVMSVIYRLNGVKVTGKDYEV